MYQEEVASLTADHLREHIGAEIEAVSLFYSDNVKLQIPKSIEVNNLVGGVYNASTDAMPAYAVDIISKVPSGISEDGLWLYTYDGHIAGIVAGLSEANVNATIKRHEQAVERFVRAHQHLHQKTSLIDNDFRILELIFTGAAFSGAEDMGEQEKRRHWIAGFRIDLSWVVSESGPGDY